MNEAISHLFKSINDDGYRVFFSQRKSRLTTNTNSNQIVTSEHPLAITIPAYITSSIKKKIQIRTTYERNRYGSSGKEKEAYNFSQIMWRGYVFKPVTVRN